MGQKIHPFSYRLGINRIWNARWFPKKNFKDQLQEDEVIRAVIKKKIAQAGVVNIEIERGSNNQYRIYIKAARPGFIIGRGGKGVEELSKAIELKLREMMRKRGVQKPSIVLSMNIEELKRSEVAASYIAQSIAWDLERRLPSRRTMKKYLDLIMQNREAQGAKIRFSGRVDGAEIARREWLSKGKLPLQTLRAHIDYGEGTAFTGYGTVGIKVWIYKGEIFESEADRKRERSGREVESNR